MKTLRFITCGSVDDGKSTLIGRLLYESKMIYTDQEQTLELESSVTSQEGELDYALLLDGLVAEREQGITIDVAYRYFSTEKRQFIVADTPGHEEYTRNMAVGASFSDCAILLIDVTKGLSSQTKRHFRICQLMGIQHYVFALNKMDLVAYDQAAYEGILAELQSFLSQFDHQATYAMIPLSAKKGDNLLAKSDQMTWYEGQALLPYLEDLDLVDKEGAEVVLPIQRVSRPNSDFRGFQGQLAAGSLSLGQTLQVLPGQMTAKVKGLYAGDKIVETASVGQAVTVELDREIDISRGDVLTASPLVQVSNSFAVQLLWTGDEPLRSGQHYYLKLGTKLISAIVTKIKHRTDITTGQAIEARTIEKNDLAYCYLSTFEEVAFSRFEDMADLGRFILIDKLTNMTAACGTISNSLQTVRNLTYHETSVTRDMRASQKGQKPKTIWFTGLSGAGKSTLANSLEAYLMHQGQHTMLLDGDNIRFGINKNLGFSKEDRLENIRRVAELAKVLNDAGVIALTSTISPTREHRELARKVIGQEDFIEVYVSTSLEECETRDVKGLYQKARRGEITNMTGIQDPYEAPRQPDVVIDTAGRSIEESLDELLHQLRPLL